MGSLSVVCRCSWCWWSLVVIVIVGIVIVLVIIVVGGGGNHSEVVDLRRWELDSTEVDNAEDDDEEVRVRVWY